MDSFPQSYPGRREYQLKAWQKLLYLVVGMVFLTVGAVFGPVLFRASAAGLPAALPSLFFLGFGVYMLAQVARSRLILDGTRITVHGAIRERTAERGDIEGFRTISSRNGSYTLLQLKQGLGTISIPNSFDTDEDYRAWMKKLPDLDQRNREEILDEISQKADLGSTPEERLQALPTARTWALFLSIVTGAGAAGLLLAPAQMRMLAAAVLVVTPMVAAMLLHRSPLLYALFKPKADPRAELVFVPILAGFGLLFRASGLHFVSTQTLLLFATPVTLAYLAAFATASGGGAARRGSLLAVLFFTGLYSYALVAVSDTLGDQGATSSYSAQVLGKHESHGRSTSYTLTLAPWGSQQQTSSVGVSSATYRAVVPGDEVCIQQHPGNLHIPWYRVEACGIAFPEDAQQ
jgi:hypothetical protein